MIYSHTITTPANTSEASPVRTEMKLTAGVIHKFQLIVPPGPQGLLHVRLLDGLHQVFPTNPDGDFSVDNANLDYRTHHELARDPFTLVAETWNTDDTYSHTCSLILGLLPKNIITPWLLSWRERQAPRDL